MIVKIAIAFGLFLILVPLWGLYLAVRPSKIVSAVTPADFGLKYEPVQFETEDGIRLSGWFIPHESAAAKAIILMHGYPADKGDILPSTLFLARDYPLFYFDFRALGTSEGGYTTAGAREGRDLAAAIRFLESRGIHTVGLWGFSMGGAVALMEAPHRSQVQAVVSDSSYASLAAMVSEIYPLPLLRRPLGAITNLWGWLLFGFHPRDVSPEKSARDIEVPVLIIHSQNDDVIPFSHALKIQEGLSEKPNARIWFRQQALHGEIDAEYQDRVLEFFKESFSRPK